MDLSQKCDEQLHFASSLILIRVGHSIFCCHCTLLDSEIQMRIIRMFPYVIVQLLNGQLLSSLTWVDLTRKFWYFFALLVLVVLISQFTTLNTFCHSQLIVAHVWQSFVKSFAGGKETEESQEREETVRRKCLLWETDFVRKLFPLENHSKNLGLQY